MPALAQALPILPERQDFSSEADRVRLSKTALKAYKRLVGEWGLTGQQAAALLDVSTSTWERLKQGQGAEPGPADAHLGARRHL